MICDIDILFTDTKDLIIPSSWKIQQVAKLKTYVYL